MAFAYKGTFTVTSNSALLPATQSNYPLMVSVTDPVLKGSGFSGPIQQIDAQRPADLLFYSNSDFTGQLKWEIDKWDPATGELIAWVKIPSLALGTVFYAGIGDASITTFQGDSENVWDSNFKTVHHGDDGTIRTLLQDSTANNFDGTQGTVSMTDVAGKIHLALDGDGTANAFVAGTSSIVTGQALTFGGWFKVSDSQAGGAIFGKGNSADDHDWMIYAANAGDFHVYCRADSNVLVDTDIAWSATYTHVVAVYNGSDLIAYINGANVASTPLTGNLQSGAGSRVGWSDYLLGTDPVNASMDETRISDIVRSANWIKIDYESQNDNPTFVAKSFAAVVGAVAPTIRRAQILTIRYRY